MYVNIKMTLMSRERRMMFDEHNGVHAGMRAIFRGMHGRKCVRGTVTQAGSRRAHYFRVWAEMYRCPGIKMESIPEYNESAMKVHKKKKKMVRTGYNMRKVNTMK